MSIDMNLLRRMSYVEVISTAYCVCGEVQVVGAIDGGDGSIQVNADNAEIVAQFLSAQTLEFFLSVEGECNDDRIIRVFQDSLAARVLQEELAKE